MSKGLAPERTRGTLEQREEEIREKILVNPNKCRKAVVAVRWGDVGSCIGESGNVRKEVDQ